MLPLRSLMFPVQYLEVGTAYVSSLNLPDAVKDMSRQLQEMILAQNSEGLPAGFINGEQFASMLTLLRGFLSPNLSHTEQLMAHFPITAHGPVGLLAVVSKNIREALRFAVQYGPLVMPAFALRVDIMEGQVHLTFDRQADFGELNALLTELVLCSYSAFGAYASPPLTGGDYYFTHDQVGPPLHIPNTPARNIHYGCRENKIVYPEAYLDRPLTMNSAGTQAAIESVVIQQVSALTPTNPVTAKVKQAVQQDVQKGALSELSVVAQSLHLSSRTLSRRLQEEGSSFIQISTQTRLEHAKMLLLSSQRSLAQIAEDTGFAEVGNFSRAFKRHFAQTPSDMRSGRVASTNPVS